MTNVPTLSVRTLVISFSETWLNDTVFDSELAFGFSEHKWFRRDRTTLGGGVACAVRSSLLPELLPHPAGCEVLLVRLRRIALTLAVCYRPPNDDISLERIATSLYAITPADTRLIVTGDFNLPEIGWRQRSRKVPTLHRTLEQNTRFVLEKHLNNGVQNKFVMCDS